MHFKTLKCKMTDDVVEAKLRRHENILHYKYRYHFHYKRDKNFSKIPIKYNRKITSEFLFEII